ncbi:MAG: glycerol-3-phosphate 1-O-acyltransferase PlsY [Clostridia bacterium]|nr:glycerol-3-phosphate 1-O-acyltransferase PlsY [Clostridia bacterium]
MIWWQVLIVIAVSYLCGNISIARIISKKKNQDITKLGSGNPGMTNTLRNFGVKLAAINLLLDMLKAFAPALISYYVFGEDRVMLYIAGLSAMCGHIYPVFYKFKGGKGISSMMGIFLASNPIATITIMLIGAVIWFIFEYGSVVSFLCITTLTVVEGIRAKMSLPELDRKIICLMLFAIFIFTWYAHRKNIERLLLGKESKASIKKKVKKKLNQKAS